jgi:hypothetical protein
MHTRPLPTKAQRLGTSFLRLRLRRARVQTRASEAPDDDGRDANISMKRGVCGRGFAPGPCSPWRYCLTRQRARGSPEVYALVIASHRESLPVAPIRRQQRPEVTGGD